MRRQRSEFRFGSDNVQGVLSASTRLMDVRHLERVVKCRHPARGPFATAMLFGPRQLLAALPSRLAFRPLPPEALFVASTRGSRCRGSNPVLAPLVVQPLLAFLSLHCQLFIVLQFLERRRHSYFFFFSTVAFIPTGLRISVYVLASRLSAGMNVSFSS